MNVINFSNLVNVLASFFSIALNLGSCQIIILMNMLVIIATKKTTQVAVHLQHTAGLF